MIDEVEKTDGRFTRWSTPKKKEEKEIDANGELINKPNFYDNIGVESELIDSDKFVNSLKCHLKIVRTKFYLLQHLC
jgi:hypothetical protein